jgi:hypothetical protein
MISLSGRPFGAVLLWALMGTSGLAAAAAVDGPKDAPENDAYWRLTFSPLAVHYHYEPTHRYVWGVGVERQRADDWLAGLAYFRNSFGQPSGFAYVGKRYPGLFGNEQVFGQLSGGILYGYRGEYKNEVPYNHHGFSPGAMASLGWQFDRNRAVTVHFLGTAAFMVQLSYDLH